MDHLIFLINGPNVGCLIIHLIGFGKFTGIGFGLGDKISLIKSKKLFKAVYTIDENFWNGTVSLQLKVKDLK